MPKSIKKRKRSCYYKVVTLHVKASLIEQMDDAIRLGELGISRSEICRKAMDIYIGKWIDWMITYPHWKEEINLIEDPQNPGTFTANLAVVEEEKKFAFVKKALKKEMGYKSMIWQFGLKFKNSKPLSTYYIKFVKRKMLESGEIQELRVRDKYGNYEVVEVYNG